MNEKQAREMAELQAFLMNRFLAAVVYFEDGNMRVRVTPDQEPALREAMDEWTRSRISFYFRKTPKQPAADSEG
jgi:hypothetical protein